MGDSRVASPMLYKGQLRLAYAAWERGKAKGRGSVSRELRPHERSRCAEHGGLLACIPWCARPTGGSHTRTTGDLTQRFMGAKRRAAPRKGVLKGAAKGIIEAETP